MTASTGSILSGDEVNQPVALPIAISEKVTATVSANEKASAILRAIPGTSDVFVGSGVFQPQWRGRSLAILTHEETAEAVGIEQAGPGPQTKDESRLRENICFGSGRRDNRDGRQTVGY
jgi:hypothetical protein